MNPTDLVGWLKSWWQIDDASRAGRRMEYGPDVAHLLRGVADMIEGDAALAGAVAVQEPDGEHISVPAAPEQLPPAMSAERRRNLLKTRLTRSERETIAKHEYMHALQAKNAALKQDAERYRWLRNNVTYFDPQAHVSPVLAPFARRIFYHASSEEYETLDATIDAAIAEREGKQ